MLVLTRKRGNVVYIGPDITVTVLEIHGEVVKLGFTAPENVIIVRDNAKQGED